MPRQLISLLAVLAGGPALLLAQSKSVSVTITEGTNIAAALSPDGRTVAFDLIGRIWSLPKQGGTARPLTDEYGDARQPAWSPDGRRIAFQSFRDGTWHIWSVAADGSDLRQHTFGMFDHREPTWSPDGKSLIFSSDRRGNYDIWQLDVEAETYQRLTDDPGDDFGPAVGPDGSMVFSSSRRAAPGIYLRLPNGATELWAAVTGQTAGASLSPDGRTVVFNVFTGSESRLMSAGKGETPRAVSAASDDVFPFRAAWASATELLYTTDGRLQLARPTGEKLAAIPFQAQVSFTRKAYQRTKRDFDGLRPSPVRGLVSPAISPDGRTIVFTALGDLWTIADGKLTRLTDDPAVQNDPQFSPDGRWLVFASDRGGPVDLWLRDMTSGTERQLSKAGGAALPSWTPDSKEIVFHVQRGLGTEIARIEVATGATSTIRSNLFDPSRVTFSPDGQTIAVAALKANSAKYREGRNEILYFDRDGKNDRWVVPPSGRGIGARGVDGPVWSPDGRRLAFTMDGVLWSMPVAKNGDPVGPPTRISAELANSPGWTADSRTLFYQAGDGFRLVSTTTGAARAVTVPLTWQRHNPTRRVVIHAGRLWDGVADRATTNMDVVVVGHRIRRVVPHQAALHRDSVVDASAYTVIPGLADAHSHQGFGTGEALGRTWLAYGVTTIRDPASAPFVIRERREAVESGVRVGPRELATGRIFDGERIYYGFNNAMTAGSQLGQELERAADLRFDLIKTYVRLPDILQERIIDFAHRNGIAVSSHELYPAVAFGADHVEHIRGTSRRGYSPKVSAMYRSYQDVIALLTASGMSLTPTVGLQGGFFNLISDEPAILDDPRLLAAYGPSYVENLRRMPRTGPFATPASMVASQGETVRRVVTGGGVVIAGTDSPIIPFGLTLLTELQHYVAGGLTPVQALRTATSMFAQAMGLSDQLGSIAPGRLADMSIVEGDPLEKIGDVRRVKIVLKNGDVFTEERLLAGPIRPAVRRAAGRP